MSDDDTLILTDLRKDFGKSSIIRGVSLAVRNGERRAIIGPNGAGKSTLFHLISGRFPSSGGSVTLLGRDITGLTPFAINRHGLSRSFQISNVFSRLSIFKNIRSALLRSSGYRYSLWHWIDRLADVAAKVDEVLVQIGLDRRCDAVVGILSYAEQRALEIAMTHSGGANVIMLDEPPAGMSHGETSQVIELIRKVIAGKTLVMVEHDITGYKQHIIARRGLNYVRENREIFAGLTVTENLLLGEKRHEPVGRWLLQDIFKLLPRLEERADVDGAVLSGGEQQMLTICRMLMGNPDLIMVDEPTEGLAPRMVELVGELLRNIAERGVSILLGEQKLSIALGISHRLYVMGQGRIVFQGTPAALQAATTIKKEWLEV